MLEYLSKDNEVHILLCSHNENAIDFFKYVPFIKVHMIPWNHSTPDYEGIAKSLNATLIARETRAELLMRVKEKTELRRNDIFLSHQEQSVFDELNTQEYIVIHPFAGSKIRMPLRVDAYKKLINLLIDEYNKRVIVIGSSYKRGKRKGNINEVVINENLEYKREGLINLTNRTSIRMASKIAANASAFFGNWSAFLCIAWEMKIPSFVFLRKGHIKVMNSKGFVNRWHDKCFAIDCNKFNEDKAIKIAARTYRKEIF